MPKLAWRILDEEKLLSSELSGYTETDAMCDSGWCHSSGECLIQASRGSSAVMVTPLPEARLRLAVPRDPLCCARLAGRQSRDRLYSC